MEPDSTKPPQPKWYYNTWVMLGMLFFVLGPLGLPLVWKHPRWTRWVKVGVTVLMVVYTLWLVDLTITAVQAVLKQAAALQSTMQY